MHIIKREYFQGIKIVKQPSIHRWSKLIFDTAKHAIKTANKNFKVPTRIILPIVCVTKS